jgi:hypothetical protein
MKTPRDRAEVLAKYLAMAPPSPYREQAQVERGVALLEGGDAEGARTVVRALRAKNDLAPVVRSALLRLERALASAR